MELREVVEHTLVQGIRPAHLNRPAQEGKEGFLEHPRLADDDEGQGVWRVVQLELGGDQLIVPASQKRLSLKSKWR